MSEFNPRILILTEADDVHAIAVAEALARRGVKATLWATSDFPTRSEETLHYYGDGRRELRVDAFDLAIQDWSFDVVWRRRPAYVLDKDALHPADRTFADGECAMFRRSLISLVAPDAFWVNPPEGAARAASKMHQHQAAMKVGLRMPETLYSNSAREVRAFMRRREGRVVYKPFLPAGWSDSVRRWLPYTAILSDEALIDESLRSTPGIFQELVTKAYEIRLTMIGARALTAKVLSQDTRSGKLDWRKAYDELIFEPAQAPIDLQDQCKALMRELGIVFGCFDFAVTPAGDYIFLEVNEMGQFLFIERCCGLPLLDAFTSFLLAARVDFSWSPTNVSVRYSDSFFEAEVMRKSEEFARCHVAVPSGLIEEER